MAKRVFLFAGHNIKPDGTGTGVHCAGFDEAVEARAFVQEVAAYLWVKYGIMVITDRDEWSLSFLTRWLRKIMRSTDIMVDIHFNAFHIEGAHGVEAFVPNNPTEHEYLLANDLVNAIHNSTGIIKRAPPVKSGNKSQHARLAILEHPYKAVNVLLEICFITNPGDRAKYRENFTKAVEFTGEVLKEHYV